MNTVYLGIERLMALGEGGVVFREAMDSFFELVRGSESGMVVGHGVEGQVGPV